MRRWCRWDVAGGKTKGDRVPAPPQGGSKQAGKGGARWRGGAARQPWGEARKGAGHLPQAAIKRDASPPSLLPGRTDPPAARGQGVAVTLGGGWGGGWPWAGGARTVAGRPPPAPPAASPGGRDTPWTTRRGSARAPLGGLGGRAGAGPSSPVVCCGVVGGGWGVAGRSGPGRVGGDLPVAPSSPGLFSTGRSPLVVPPVVAPPAWRAAAAALPLGGAVPWWPVGGLGRGVGWGGGAQGGRPGLTPIPPTSVLPPPKRGGNSRGGERGGGISPVR